MSLNSSLRSHSPEKCEAEADLLNYLVEQNFDELDEQSRDQAKSLLESLFKRQKKMDLAGNYAHISQRRKNPRIRWVVDNEQRGEHDLRNGESMKVQKKKRRCVQCRRVDIFTWICSVFFPDYYRDYFSINEENLKINDGEVIEKLMSMLENKIERNEQAHKNWYKLKYRVLLYNAFSESISTKNENYGDPTDF